MEEGSGEVGIWALPDDCTSHILSLTSPRDACRSLAISSGFRSAAESDTVWERFLPSDYREIISRSVAPVVFSTKKDLYFRLCDSPILLDGGSKSFALDKRSGKKCYMIGARQLSIIWGDALNYWNWTTLPESRFSEVAQLMAVCWLHIQGWMETRLLSRNTTYAAYFVFTDAVDFQGFEGVPIKVSVRGIGNGGECEDRTVYLQSQVSMDAPEPQDGQLPRDRGDGWMEIEMGEFFVDEDDGQVQMLLKEIQVLNWKHGLVVQGIELRPKEGT